MIYIQTFDFENESVELSIDVFLCREARNVDSSAYRIFKLDGSIRYDAYCDDFGPFNIASTTRFVELFTREMEACALSGSHQLAFVANKGKRGFTNAAFLLGAFMILKHGHSADEVQARFQHLNPALFEGYRDATDTVSDFRLSSLDCWRALARGRKLGWVAVPSQPSEPEWGKIDREMYEHYDNPLNGDLHEVVPGKFVAFRGPADLGGGMYRDNVKTRTRRFDAKFYLDIFEELNVSTVIRLNEKQYEGEVFEDHGITHHDLHFDDCTAPPPEIFKRFVHIVDNATGLVAVHCKTGLGRTGTLIALYLMRTHGFSGREAIAWLRLMRPGSVTGVQQHFLCAIDAAMRKRQAAALSKPCGRDSESVKGFSCTP